MAELLPVPDDSKETRKSQAELLAAIVGLGPVATRFSHLFEFAVDSDGRRVMEHALPYEWLGVKLAEDFIARAQQSGDEHVRRIGHYGPVWQGCRGIGMVLSFAGSAYKRHTANEWRSIDWVEFETSLRASSDIIRTFASIDRDRAGIREIDFGIDVRYRNIPSYERIPFVFERNDDGDLRYGLSMHTLRQADFLIAQEEESGKLSELPSHRKCPALGIVMETLWQQAITDCMKGPTLFPNDLSDGPVTY